MNILVWPGPESDSRPGTLVCGALLVIGATAAGVLTGSLWWVAVAVVVMVAAVVATIALATDVPWQKLQGCVLLCLAGVGGYLTTLLSLSWIVVSLGGCLLIVAVSVTSPIAVPLLAAWHLVLTVFYAAAVPNTQLDWALPTLTIIVVFALGIFFLRWHLAARQHAMLADANRLTVQLRIAQESLSALRNAHQVLRRQVKVPQQHQRLSAHIDGLAHDLNNVLTPVYAYAELLEQSGLSAAQRDMLSEIKAGTEHATRVGGEMLRRAQAQDVSATQIDLLEEIRHLATLASSTLPKPFHVMYDLRLLTARVRLHRDEFQQAFLTLLLYANQHLSDTGTLGLTVRECYLQEADLSALSPPLIRPAGAYLCVDIVAEQNTQLTSGLADFLLPALVHSDAPSPHTAVLEFARSHGAGVATTFGGGEAVTLCIPKNLALTAHLAERPAVEVLRNCHILVIDDNAAVRGVSKTVLENAGYHVTDTDRGESAIKLFEAASRPYAAVLLDVRMPGIGGIATLKQLRGMAPAIPVLLYSGFDQGVVLEQLSRDAEVAFLPKPFRAADLVAAMDNLMLKR